MFLLELLLGFLDNWQKESHWLLHLEFYWWLQLSPLIRVFWVPIISYSHVHHDDIIGNLWEYSNQVCCFGIGQVIGSLHFFLTFLVYYTIFFKWTALPCKGQCWHENDYEACLYGICVLFGERWKDLFYVSLPVPFSLAFEVHGVTCLWLLAEISYSELLGNDIGWPPSIVKNITGLDFPRAGH